MKTKEGLWRLSPSGLYGFEECKSCFWLEHHHGRPPGIPPVLNMAMDSIFKARYDSFREKGEMPPEIRKLEKEGIRLFDDLETLNKWRGHAKYLKVADERTGFELSGKIDEILVEKNGHLIPTDFKSSGYAPKEDKQKYYIAQLNAYAYMFRHQGYKPSNRGILLHYFVKDVKNPSLEVSFENHIDPVNLDLKKFEKLLKDVVELLNGPYPGDGLECKSCLYHAGRQEIRGTENIIEI